MLFDDDIFFKINIPTLLTNIENGFSRGNLFNNIYKPYKNYKYECPKGNTDKENELLDIMMLGFAINDLNLYLDLNPKDTDILEKFMIVKNILEEKTSNYISKYGPLNVLDNNSDTKFDWTNNPWPWERNEGVKYV